MPVEIKLDFYEHPKTWNRRISAVEKCLPAGSSSLVRLQTAHVKWREASGKITEEQQKIVQHLYDCWHAANEEIDKKNETASNHKKWKFTTTLAFIALLASLISTSISAYFQYQNMQINKKRLEISITNSKPSIADKPEVKKEPPSTPST